MSHALHQYQAAHEAAALALALLRVDRANPRLIARAVRSLRRCERLRAQLLSTLHP